MGKIKSRRTLHVSPKLLITLKKLQGEIKAITGQEPNLTDLIEEFFTLPNFNDLKNQILRRISDKDLIELKFDKELK